ncbi:MAG: hypothetical protein IE885_01285 [Campylobacterales bacterium]|nr:hypothetical protein [Campylobacterales bacterium]
MRIDLMSVIYNTSMIILAFVTALVVTKTLMKWIKRTDQKKENNEESGE